MKKSTLNKKPVYAGLYFKMSDISASQMFAFFEKYTDSMCIGVHKSLWDCEKLKDWVSKECKGRGFFGIRPAPDGGMYIIEYSFDKKTFEKYALDGVAKGPQSIDDWFFESEIDVEKDVSLLIDIDGYGVNGTVVVETGVSESKWNKMSFGEKEAVAKITLFENVDWGWRLASESDIEKWG